MGRLDTWTVVTLTVTLIWAVAYIAAMFFDPKLQKLAEGTTPVLMAVIGAYTANKVSERVGPLRRNGNGNGNGRGLDRGQENGGTDEQ